MPAQKDQDFHDPVEVAVCVFILLFIVLPLVGSAGWAALALMSMIWKSSAWVLVAVFLGAAVATTRTVSGL